MSVIQLKQISSLEKVFLTDHAEDKEEFTHTTALKGERISYQIMYTALSYMKTDVCINLNSPLKESVSLRLVGNVPSELPAYEENSDDNYITKKPGLFPDVLYPLPDNKIEIIPRSYHALWITVEISPETQAGTYPIEISFVNTELDISKTMTFYIEVIGALLPKQNLIYTQWFHADCIASYYDLEIFSDEHWAMIEKFIEMAERTGINMILTPLFTLPLDTAVGGERPTLQLVDVFINQGKYTFGFDKLIKWIKICKRYKIKYFEMSHLFTQWGAEFTPKIMAHVDGVIEKVFGWHVRADSPEYKKFLNQFLPELIIVLKRERIAEYTYFHISDEPNQTHIESYKKAKETVKDLLSEFKTIDALSDYDFYKLGLVDMPIPHSRKVQEFIDNGVEDLWTYYCCVQGNENLSNRFMAMPSYRNRIIAAQLYKYGIKGFLHWGYNFYYSQYSKYEINPFLVTDAINAFPSGDAFSVYPYKDRPIESVRSVVFYEALQDLRAFKMLESLIGREQVIELLEKDIQPITFSKYPYNDKWLQSKRQEINRMIADKIS